MSSPIVDAVTQVFTALKELVAEGVVAIPSLSVRKTYRSAMFREELEEGVLAIVFPQGSSRNRDGQSSVFDEYQVDVAVELVTQLNPGDPVGQQETMLNHCQDIADGLSRKLAMSLGLFASQDGGMFEETAVDELALISVKCSGIYRVMHKVTL